MWVVSCELWVKIPHPEHTHYPYLHFQILHSPLTIDHTRWPWNMFCDHRTWSIWTLIIDYTRWPWNMFCDHRTWSRAYNVFFGNRTCPMDPGTYMNSTSFEICELGVASCELRIYTVLWVHTYIHAFCSVTQTVLNDARVHTNAGNHSLCVTQPTQRQMGQVTVKRSGVPALVF